MKAMCFLIMLVSSTAILSCEKDDSGKSTEPYGWFLTGDSPKDYKIGIEDQDAQHGQKCGFIESVVDTVKGFGTLMQYCSDKEFSGERVRMKGYIQTLAPVSTFALMWVRVDDYARNISADFDNMQDRPIEGTHYWTSCELIFDVPDSLCVINFGVLISGIGKVWIDNVTFEIVSPTTPKTAIFLNQALPSGFQFPENIPEAPVNLDFEE